jgi:hypothetical protein
VPIVRVTTELEGAVRFIREVRFKGELLGDYKEYT